MRILSDYERVVKVIAAQTGIDENEISEVHFLVDNLGMDTMDIQEVVMALEEEFNIATGCLWIGKDISIDGLVRRVAVAVQHSSEESFEVNEQGGMKETSGKLRWTLLPLDALKEVVKVLEYGARKYSADNWQKVDKEKYKEALWRHWVAYNQGEKKDPETGLSHLAHLLCDGLFLLWFDLQEDKND